MKIPSCTAFLLTVRRLPRVGALSLLGGHTRHLVGILGLQPGSDVLQRGMTSLAQPKKKVKEITVLDDALTQLKAMPERKFTQGWEKYPIAWVSYTRIPCLTAGLSSTGNENLDSDR